MATSHFDHFKAVPNGGGFEEASVIARLSSAYVVAAKVCGVSMSINK